MNLKVKFGKINDRLAESLEKIEGLEKANAVLKEENNRLNKNLIYENKLKGGNKFIYFSNKMIIILENNRKIESLEKRIEFLLESDLNLITMSQDKLRRCFTDLMKENENNKRDVETKNKEILRMKEQINTLNYRLGRMNIKFENMKNEKSHESNFRAYKTESGNTNDILSITNIPKNLDFRVNSLKVEYARKK